MSRFQKTPFYCGGCGSSEAIGITLRLLPSLLFQKKRGNKPSTVTFAIHAR